MTTAVIESLEKRFSPAQRFEIRAEPGGPERIIGHAAVFNQWSPIWEGFRERILPGAFAASLREIAADPDGDVIAMDYHQDPKPLGSLKSGHLVIREDEAGLYTEITPTDTTYARDLKTNIGAGVIRRMSFRFTVRPGGENWTDGQDGIPERTLSDLNIIEVSPVLFAYYPGTDASMRSLHPDVALRSLESWKRDHQPKSYAASRAAKRMHLDLIARRIPLRTQETHA